MSLSREELVARYKQWTARDPRYRAAGDFIAAYRADLAAGNVERTEFYDSLQAGLAKYGTLTDKQVEALLRSVEQARMRAAIDKQLPERIDVPAALLGNRATITGRIIVLKESGGEYGRVLRMTVADDRGFRVNSTVPSSVLTDLFRPLINGHPAADDQIEIASHRLGEVEVRIQFDVRLEPSTGNPSLAFGKQPTKATII